MPNYHTLIVLGTGRALYIQCLFHTAQKKRQIVVNTVSGAQRVNRHTALNRGKACFYMYRYCVRSAVTSLQGLRCFW